MVIRTREDIRTDQTEAGTVVMTAATLGETMGVALEEMMGVAAVTLVVETSDRAAHLAHHGDNDRWLIHVSYSNVYMNGFGVAFCMWTSII